MAGNTTIQIPTNVADATVLKRFLLELVNYIDIAKGIKEGDNTITQSYVTNILLPYVDNSFAGYATETWVTGTALSGYATEAWVTNHAYTSNPEQTAIVDLNQTISATYTQSEVQAISDKVDELLVALRNANIISI